MQKGRREKAKRDPTRKKDEWGGRGTGQGKLNPIKRGAGSENSRAKARQKAIDGEKRGTSREKDTGGFV